MADETPQLEPANWADVLWLTLVLPRNVANGVFEVCCRLQNGLAATSARIDDRRRFERAVAHDLEALTGGEHE